MEKFALVKPLIIIAGTPLPFSKGGGGGRTFQKLSHLGGGLPKILLERGDNHEKVGGGVM